MNKTKTHYAPVGTVRLNMERLEWFIKADIADFILLDGFVQYETNLGRYFFRDANSNLLATAHLDTVQGIKNFELSHGIPENKYTSWVTRVWDKELHKYVPKVEETKSKVKKVVDKYAPLVVKSSRLDNRLGAYIVCDLLPQLGIYTDVLLTEGEESCCSTAQMFENERQVQYNWMFSFDREGQDVVMYQYENYDSKDMLEKHDLELDMGSYSDISELDFLGCVGFNVGAGNYRSHMHDAFFVVKHCLKQVRKFRSFYSEFRDTFMEYDTGDKVKFPYGFRGGWSSFSYHDWTPLPRRESDDTKLLGDGGRGMTAGQGWAQEDGYTRIFDHDYDGLPANGQLVCPWCGGYDVRLTLVDDLYRCTWCDCVMNADGTSQDATLRYTKLGRCDFCHTTKGEEHLTYVIDSRPDIQFVCTCCLQAFYRKCDTCLALVHNRLTTFIINGDGTSQVCDACYDLHVIDNMSETKHRDMEVENCEYCGASYYKADKELERFGEAWLCTDCFEDMNTNLSLK